MEWFDKKYNNDINYAIMSRLWWDWQFKEEWEKKIWMKGKWHNLLSLCRIWYLKISFSITSSPTSTNSPEEYLITSGAEKQEVKAENYNQLSSTLKHLATSVISLWCNYQMLGYSFWIESIACLVSCTKPGMSLSGLGSLIRTLQTVDEEGKKERIIFTRTVVDI